MNTLKKMTVVMLGVATLGSTAFICAETRHTGVETGRLSAAIEVDQQVSRDLTEQMRMALEAPRAATVRREPTVEITEVSDLVVVAATRLPALDPIEVVRVARAAPSTQL